MQYRSLLNLSLVAAAAITANRCVTPTGGVPAAGANVLGVSLNAAASGERFSIVALGTATIEAGAPITAGAQVETLNDGRITPLDEGVAIGRALQAAGAAGELIEVLLIPN